MKRWILAGAVMVMAIFAFAFVACSDDDDDGDNGEPTTVETPMAETPMAETPVAGETPSVAVAPITMNEVDGSGVAGTASITETDTGGTDVVVTISVGLDPGEHQSHIHHGTCATQPGEIHVNLSNVVVAEDGSAPAVTTTDPQPADGSAAPPFSHWLAREHYVAVHALDGTLVSCGDVVAAS